MSSKLDYLKKYMGNSKKDKEQRKRDLKLLAKY